jgi:hypothetical protein
VVSSVNGRGVQSGSKATNEAHTPLSLPCSCCRMFGGLAMINAVGDHATLADLWFFTPSIAQWTLVSGGPTGVAWSAFQYGQFRVPSSKSSVPSRHSHSMSIDVNAGRIYITGGSTDVAQSFLLSDQWSYDIASNTSTWIGGSASTTASSAYPPSTGIAYARLIAYGRNALGGASWVDVSGGLWWGMGFTQQDYCNGRCSAGVIIGSPALLHNAMLTSLCSMLFVQISGSCLLSLRGYSQS